ncbi:hypothetical protein ACQ4PT_034058 [Festuca glaucescens]
MDEKMQVFWCKAGKDFSEGLVYIENDADIVSMIEVARVHKTLSLFVDHTNFVKSLRSDVLTNGRTEEDVVELEQNASGRAVDNDHNASGRGVENERMDIDMADMAATCENKRRGKQSFDEAVDEETDSDFYDSDFDAEDGDDDIFLATVDRSVNDDNAPLEIIELEDDVGLENEDLQLTKEQKEELQYKFKQFNAEVDMEQPVFKTGMIFANVKELRAEITAYNMKERVKIKKVGNESGRIHVLQHKGSDNPIPLDVEPASAPLVAHQHPPRCLSPSSIRVAARRPPASASSLAAHQPPPRSSSPSSLQHAARRPPASAALLAH